MIVFDEQKIIEGKIEVARPKKALVSGITGQDGSYMAELLLHLGYDVHGIVRRSSVDNLVRIRHIQRRLVLHYGDLIDYGFLKELIQLYRYNIIYNFAAQSHVQTSFSCPAYTRRINSDSVFDLLAILRDFSPRTRFYQASTSEIFGDTPAPQGLDSPFNPVSPYAVSKLNAHNLVSEFRSEHGLYAVSGILFNHESPRRGYDFVTRKITRAVSDFFWGRRSPSSDPLVLGNITSSRDWGFAPEYMFLIHQQMQQDEPKDFVLGTGETHTVEEFLKASFGLVGLDWQDFVDHDSPEFIRPKDVALLQAKTSIEPKIKFDKIVEVMVKHDCYEVAPLWWYDWEYAPIFAWRAD